MSAVNKLRSRQCTVPTEVELKAVVFALRIATNGRISAEDFAAKLVGVDRRRCDEVSAHRIPGRMEALVVCNMSCDARAHLQGIEKSRDHVVDVRGNKSNHYETDSHEI